MPRVVSLPLLVVSVVAVISLLVAGIVSPGADDKARPPLGEVRIEKVLNVQLPEI